MRFERLRARGLGPFREEVDVDFASLPGVLTAVVGENGAGKSTLLELLGGTLFRVCPTRGSLRDLATERGAWAEVEVVNGAPWRVRQTVDPVSGKGEALIVDSSGRPVVDTAKVRDADAWVRAHLPPSEVLYASTLGVQGSEGFLAMKPAERKSVLLRILGVEELEDLAADARERAREARQALAVVEARLSDERRRGGDVDALRADVVAARERVAAAEVALNEAKVGLERAREARQVEGRRADLEARLRALTGRMGSLRDVLGRADEIRCAVDERARILANLDDVEARRREESEAVAALRARLDAERATWEAARREVADAEQRITRARARLADRARVGDAARELPAAREAVTAAELALEAERAEVERLQSQRLAGAEDRIGRLRTALSEIASHRADCHAYDEDVGHELRDFDETDVEQLEAEARKALDEDDATVRAAQGLPGLLRAAQAAHLDARNVLAAVLRRVQELDRLAARAEDIARAEEDLAVAEAALASAKTRAREARARGVALYEELEVASATLEQTDARIKAIRTSLDAIGPLADRAPALAAAEAQLADLETQASELGAGLEALPAPDLEALACDWRAVVRDAEREVRDAERDLAAGERALEQAERAAERVAELEGERASVERNLAEWNVLARDLGKDGVQAALIDAAGPELTELCNDLLHHAFGPRWSVSIETTRLSADGKKQLEGLDVRVIDTERGRDALVETYSGGERVLLGEAVSLALTMLACRRSGLEGVTLVRDESGAALDPDRARAYVAMLRRAADLVGASRVLLVSHVPEVADLCDSRLVVADGRVEVER